MSLTKQQLDDLRDLLASAGWSVLMAHIDAEWGPSGFGAKIARTLGDDSADTAIKLRQLEQATVAQREVQRIVGWPKEQLDKATAEARATAFTATGFGNRRGGL